MITNQYFRLPKQILNTFPQGTAIIKTMASNFGFVILSAFLLGFSIPASASICLSSVADHQKNKTQLPAAFQNLPVTLSGKKFGGIAAVRIRTDGEKLKLESAVAILHKIYTDEAYIKKVCFEPTKMEVTTELGSVQTVAIKDSSFEIENVEFKKTTDAEFAKAVAKVQSWKGKEEKARTGADQ